MDHDVFSISSCFVLFAVLISYVILSVCVSVFLLYVDWTQERLEQWA